MNDSFHLICLAPSFAEWVTLSGGLPKQTSRQVAFKIEEGQDEDVKACFFPTDWRVDPKGKTHTVVVLSSEWCRYRKLYFPFKDAKKIRQAIPFELESDLLEDLNRYVYNVRMISQGEGTLVVVSLLEKNILEEVLRSVEGGGFRPVRVTASSVVLPREEDKKGLECQVYLGPEEAVVVLDQDGVPMTAKSFEVPSAPGFSSEQETISPDQGLLKLQESARREEFRNKTNRWMEEITRFIRNLAMGGEVQVQLHGLYAPLVVWRGNRMEWAEKDAALPAGWLEAAKERLKDEEEQREKEKKGEEKNEDKAELKTSGQAGLGKKQSDKTKQIALQKELAKLKALEEKKLQRRDQEKKKTQVRANKIYSDWKTKYTRLKARQRADWKDLKNKLWEERNKFWAEDKTSKAATKKENAMRAQAERSGQLVEYRKAADERETKRKENLRGKYAKLKAQQAQTRKTAWADIKKARREMKSQWKTEIQEIWAEWDQKFPLPQDNENIEKQKQTNTSKKEKKISGRWSLGVAMEAVANPEELWGSREGNFYRRMPSFQFGGLQGIPRPPGRLLVMGISLVALMVGNSTLNMTLLKQEDAALSQELDQIYQRYLPPGLAPAERMRVLRQKVDDLGRTKGASGGEGVRALAVMEQVSMAAAGLAGLVVDSVMVDERSGLLSGRATDENSPRAFQQRLATGQGRITGELSFSKQGADTRFNLHWSY
ncbi:MAG: hypothetical protein OEV94_04380 [Deltaproteobacteria bacterium]|nr:hypothetical protein [Deltaproteobacteria bacterium]